MQECLKGNDRKYSTIFIEIVNFIRARNLRVLNVQARVLSPEAALAESNHIKIFPYLDAHHIHGILR